MEHRKSSKNAPRGFRTLLLAGSAVVCADVASAEPIQPFWLMPTTLATSLGVEKTTATEQVKEQVNKLRARVFAQQTVNLLSLDTSAADAGEDVPLPFSESTPYDAPVTLKLRSGSYDLEPAVGVKVDRLAEGANFTTGSVATESVGVDATLFDGRVAISSDFAKTIDETDTRDFRDPQLREADRSMRLSDTSRRTRFSAKVIDTENLRLLVDGEMGETSEGFATSLRELPTGRLILPGSWQTMSSSLEFGEASVKVDYQDFVTRAENLKRQGVTVGYAQSEISVYRKEGMEFNLTQGGQWLKRSQYAGVTADVMVADVIPPAVADAIDPIRPFLPTSVFAAFERGDIVRAELLPGPRDRVDTANIALTWETNFGETTASVWERRIKTDIYTPDGEDSIPLARSRDRFIDISHKIRRGNWKFGAGLSMIETDDTSLGVRNADSEIAPHVSIAYAPDGGPTVELRLGAADAQSQIIDDNLAARSKTRQLQLSVDLSTFAQEELNREDAKLKLEYRYDLNGSERDAAGRERGGGHALLLTFSTPLN
jgi:hypothetical protein